MAPAEIHLVVIVVTVLLDTAVLSVKTCSIIVLPILACPAEFQLVKMTMSLKHSNAYVWQVLLEPSAK